MLANGVKETTTTTGTGTVTLSAVTGFPRFSNAFSVGQHVDYAIRSGDNWEWGLGKVAAGSTLERTFVTEKYEGGALTKNPGTGVALTGTSEVFCTASSATIGRLAVPPQIAPTIKVFSAVGVQQDTYDSEFTLSADKFFYIPFVWPAHAPRYCTGVTLHVRTTGTATKLRVGIVDERTSMATRTLVGQTADISVTTTGVKSATLALALPLPRYTLAVIANGTVGLSSRNAVLSDPYVNVNNGFYQQRSPSNSPGTFASWTSITEANLRQDWISSDQDTLRLFNIGLEQ